MTNPINNLSKYPRRPFREKSQSSVHNTLSNFNDYNIPSLKDLNVSVSDSEFNDLIEDVTNDLAHINLKKYSNGMLKAAKTEKMNSARNESLTCQPLSKDYDIISKLLDKIKSLEISNRYHEKEIRDKDLRIKVLNDKCNLYKTASEVKDINYDKFKELENKCEKLENQIIEMESFLADYGLIWVGDKSFQCGSDFEEIVNINDQNVTVQPGSARRFIVDYDKIFKNISELNIMMDSDEVKIAMTAPQRLELKKQPAVPITFYSNGISLFSGPFRPFSDESTRQVINDLIDGYFPSELEGKYPTGVPINAIDRRNIMYEITSKNVFQGFGRTLGGNSSVSKLTGFKTTDIVNQQYDQPYTGVLTSNASTQLTMEQFLNQLPQNTISKDGKVFAIRNSIRDILENKSPNIANVSPTKDDTVDLSSSSGKVAKIKIRSLKGDKVFNVTLHETALVSDLYRKMYEVSHLSSDNYVLVLSYPVRKILTDFTETIEQCGLAPTASLHIESLMS